MLENLNIDQNVFTVEKDLVRTIKCHNILEHRDLKAVVLLWGYCWQRYDV